MQSPISHGARDDLAGPPSSLVPVNGLRQRFATAMLVIVPLAAIIFFTPRIYGVLLLSFMVLAGAWEWGGFFPKMNKPLRVAYVALIGIGMLIAWFGGGTAVMPVLWVAMVWWLFAFAWVLRFPTPVPVLLVLFGGLFVLVPGWLALARLHMQLGPQWLTFFFFVIAAADTGAYFSGKAFGRTRLAPKVSPGKTWEGALGGLVFVLLIAVAGAYWFGWSPIFMISLCLAVALASVIGDLTISMFKRHAHLKDSGSLFPGHGGVLDRIDSMSAGAPLFVIGLGWARSMA
ncbi:MAG: phosphatidate cytidylyltransferase [Gammaproteobacteria bacterium]|nr:phosphatidate cytidylyltransferase [Gammaproteobacteria bacterium]